MALRWRTAASRARAFRPSPAEVAAPRPTRRQTAALLVVLVVVAVAIAAVSYLVRPERARAFTLYHGSIFLSDSVAPVSVDLASGRPTVRLVQAAAQVGAKTTADLSIVPLQDGTLMLNRLTGEFNLVASTGFVVKTSGGVPIAQRAGSTGAAGIADGQQAFIEQSGPSGTSVYLVSQSTVQTAGVVQGKVRPRALRSMPEAASLAPGASAVSQGNLWLLVGTGTARTVRRLHVPAGSAPGVVLASSDHGQVPAVSAIEATSSPTAVAVADADSITIEGGDTVHFPKVAGADQVLAASQASGRLAWLIHGSAGWYSVSVDADGTALRGPTRLAGIEPAADLAPPAMSEGGLYTLDRTSGRSYRIGDDGTLTALPDYPLATEHGKVIEPAGFTDGYVISRGARVIVNSPSHLEALVLFTDGSHPPLVIEKSSAVSVNAGSGADALTRSHHAASTSGAKTRSTPRQQQPATPVDNNVDCKDIQQKPHIPSIVDAVPGSRSVQLSWTYPTPDPQDCEPSTYEVSVSLVSDDAPSPPGAVQVQGQTSVNLAGLFPSTEYRVTVTAYINGQGTASAPRLVTTGPAGPPAPTDVVATPDDAGNWDVTWRSCGTVQQGCVVSSSWKVIPQFCDGLGLSGAPSPITVAADPTTAVQPPARLTGGDALLGRGVRFEVEGIGMNNAIGTPSAATPCTYSWTPPVASAITVSASTPPATGAQQTSTTRATVRFADGAIHDLGGVGGTLTYQLLDADGTVVTSKADTTATSVTLGGLVPGEHYSVRVIATPPHHPSAAVTLPAVAVVPAQANWPNPTVDANCGNDSFSTCSLSVSFGLGGAQLHGETFDLDNSQLVCGSSGMPLNASNVSPDQTLTFEVDRFSYNGSCTVQLRLAQNGATATSPPLFGSGDSPQGTAPVSIDEPSITTTQGDFSASWTGGYDNPSVQVSYHGSDLLNLATNWSVVVTNATTTDCGDSSNGPNTTVAVDPSCVNQGGTFTVSVGYTYLGQNQNYSGIAVQGNAPQPLQSSQVSFTAAWNTDATNPAVVVHYTGSADPSQLQNVAWSEAVTSNGVTCGSSTRDPGNGDIDVPVDYTVCPVSGANYVVTIGYTDNTYGGSGSYQPAIDGTPPQ